MVQASKFPLSEMRHTAVYWGTPVWDEFGKRSFASPVEIACRWEDRAESFVNPDGLTTVSRAIVYVNQDLDLRGYLFLGDLDDLSSAEEGDPQDVAEAYDIMRFDKITDLENTVTMRKAWLGI